MILNTNILSIQTTQSQNNNTILGAIDPSIPLWVPYSGAWSSGSGSEIDPYVVDYYDWINYFDPSNYEGVRFTSHSNWLIYNFDVNYLVLDDLTNNIKFYNTTVRNWVEGDASYLLFENCTISLFRPSGMVSSIIHNSTIGRCNIWTSSGLIIDKSTILSSLELYQSNDDFVLKNSELNYLYLGWGVQSMGQTSLSFINITFTYNETNNILFRPNYKHHGLFFHNITFNSPLPLNIQYPDDFFNSIVSNISNTKIGELTPKISIKGQQLLIRELNADSIELNESLDCDIYNSSVMFLNLNDNSNTKIYYCNISEISGDISNTNIFNNSIDNIQLKGSEFKLINNTLVNITQVEGLIADSEINYNFIGNSIKPGRFVFNYETLNLSISNNIAYDASISFISIIDQEFVIKKNIFYPSSTNPGRPIISLEKNYGQTIQEISNNRFEENDICILIKKGANIHINNNNFTKVDVAIKFNESSCTNINIEGNNLSAHYPIYMVPIEGGQAYNLLVQKNEFSNYTLGFRLYTSSGVVKDNNFLKPTNLLFQSGFNSDFTFTNNYHLGSESFFNQLLINDPSLSHDGFYWVYNYTLLGTYIEKNPAINRERNVLSDYVSFTSNHLNNSIFEKMDGSIEFEFEFSPLPRSIKSDVRIYLNRNLIQIINYEEFIQMNYKIILSFSQTLNGNFTIRLNYRDGNGESSDYYLYYEIRDDINSSDGDNNIWIYITIGVSILAAGGGIGYFVLRKRRWN